MNLMDLFIKIGIDDQATSKIGKITGVVGNGLKTAAKVGAAAIGTASAAIASLTAMSINGFAEYEQLAGGAQKIFDQMDYAKIAQDAGNAYKELGLSANQYLSVINDVGATFAATMGDEAGYEAAKTGLKAISDYASGTGKNVDELSQKFTLITRSTSSYQSIADQFSGILPATSSGFLEQAQAAGILSDSYKELTQVPIDEYQAAVSEMLQQGVKDLGLANNTMNEAFSTLSGSLSMAKSSWSNLVTGIADDSANLDMLISNFVESVGAVATNLIPKISVALNGAAKLIRDLVPVIVSEIPKIINDNLPIIAEAAVGIIKSLADGISQNQKMLIDTAVDVVTFLSKSFIEMLPEIVQLGLDVIVSLANGIAESLPELVPTIIDVISQIVDTLTSPNNLSALLAASLAIIIALADGLIDSLPKLLEKGPEIVENLVDTIIENAPKLLESALELVVSLATGIVSNLPKMVESGIKMVSSINEGITGVFSSLVAKGAEIIDSVRSGFAAKVEEAKSWGRDLIQNFIDGITAKWQALKDKVASVAQTVKDFIGFSEPKKGPLSNFHTYAPDMMDLFISGIEGSRNKLMGAISDTFDFGEQTISAGVNYSTHAGRSWGGNVPARGNVSVVQNIYSEAKTAADLMQEAIYQQERAVLLGV